ncbi:MAG: methylmalonyl-CoA mutase [Kofleriaceae bacterium]|jgi:methylmalonyl-CoA mutase N-terminal domain/subunit|nr:methylmalonyl-CoA mutase [Kofleriaceae bacterium]MBP6840281.1 methylmalonyl-CoA mutase [Kofleriaceae bacterium]MBP9205617.1 methylmalonyl-CoA mutase [Kofleriaceae bacterium]
MPPVKKPEPAAEHRTMSGIPLKASYGPDDLSSRGWSYDEKLGPPGSFPYTRGPHATMYRGKPWTMRMFAGFGTPEDTNQRFKFLLAQGQTGLSTAFDMPTLMGYDPDSPRSLGEVGREGVSVASLDDMMRLFGDIPLDQVSTSMTINAPAAVLLAMYVAVAEKQGVSADRLRGTLQNDMLKEFIAQKEWISPIRGHMRIIRDMLAWCTTAMPQWNTISISGYHIREAGATAVQELAFTLADGIGYVQLGVDAGLDVDAFAPRLSFFFDVHNDFFEEVAKFRAARRMWATIMRERFGAKNPRSWLLRTHAQTAGVSLMAQQPLNNVVRTTMQALAAVLGGTQSLHTNSYDETYALPTEEAAGLALRTQQVIYEESGVASVADPLAGSYFVETLTDQVEAAAWEYIRKIDAMGGIVKAVEEGYPQREIARSAFDFQREVDGGRRGIVGVNKHVSADEGDGIPTLKIEMEVEHQQIARVKETRAKRDAGAVTAALAAVRAGLSDDHTNVMPLILDAVRAYATVGEISDLFRSELGEYRDPAYL